jgi:hypothetical protein
MSQLSVQVQFKATDRVDHACIRDIVITGTILKDEERRGFTINLPRFMKNYTIMRFKTIVSVILSRRTIKISVRNVESDVFLLK